MTQMNKLITWGGILLTAALMLPGCSKTTISGEPTVEHTVAESTNIESADAESTAADITEENSGKAEENAESSAAALPVTESENGLFLMEEGKSYLLDMDGDGTAETVRYHIAEDPDYLYPEIYINDQLHFNDQATYGYSVEIYLTDIDKEDNYREVFVYATTDSETVQAVSFLRYQNNRLQLLGNLSGRTIFDGAGLYFRGGAAEVRGDGTVVLNIDTPVYAGMFGCYYVPVSFRLEGDNFVEIPQDSYTWSVDHPGYVVHSAFTAVTEPGGNEAAFSAAPGELVKFDGLCILDGLFYGRVTNSAGISGWLIELEGISPGDEGAYFEEVMVWG